MTARTTSQLQRIFDPHEQAETDVVHEVAVEPDPLGLRVRSVLDPQRLELEGCARAHALAEEARPDGGEAEQAALLVENAFRDGDRRPAPAEQQRESVVGVPLGERVEIVLPVEHRHRVDDERAVPHAVTHADGEPTWMRPEIGSRTDAEVPYRVRPRDA